MGELAGAGVGAIANRSQSSRPGVPHKSLQCEGLVRERVRRLTVELPLSVESLSNAPEE